MDSPQPQLDFDELCDVFVRLGAVTPPAELHGLLAGQLCAGRRIDAVSWIALATEFMELDTAPDEQDQDELLAIFVGTLAQLEESELAFQLLQPDDDTEFLVRVEALAQWVQGFLAGFALVERDTPLPPIVSDAIGDLAAIAQVGVPDEDAELGGEADLLEISEYVRLVVMNLYLECGGIGNADVDALAGISPEQLESQLLGSSPAEQEPSLGGGHKMQGLFGNKKLH